MQERAPCKRADSIAKAFARGPDFRDRSGIGLGDAVPVGREHAFPLEDERPSRDHDARGGPIQGGDRLVDAGNRVNQLPDDAEMVHAPHPARVRQSRDGRCCALERRIGALLAA